MITHKYTHIQHIYVYYEHNTKELLRLHIHIIEMLVQPIN